MSDCIEPAIDANSGDGVHVNGDADNVKNAILEELG